MTAVVPPVFEAADTLAATASATVRTRWPLKRVLRWTSLVGLVALFGLEITILTPYLTNALESLRRPNPWWLLVALLAEGLSMGEFARVQRRMLSAAGQRVGMGSMVGLTYAANALSVTFPGGTALSSGYVFKKLRSWGATVPAAGFTVVASGLLSFVGFAVLAAFVGISAGDNLTSSVLIVATALVIAVATVTLRHRDPAVLLQRVILGSLRRANRVLRRRPDAGVIAAQRFTRDLTAIHPRFRDWLVGLAHAVVNWTADLVCLFACCEAIGADKASLVLVMVAYIAGMSASSISLLPGGFGIVDAAMIFALTSGGVSTVAATAGVVLYRVISFLLVVGAGWVMWISSWALDRRSARTASSESAMGADAASAVLMS